MGTLKTRASLLARFLLCFTLIACLWIVSIRYRIGPFDYNGGFWVPNNSGAFTDADRLLLAATLALLVGLLGLYRSGRISAVVMVIFSLLLITMIDHGWAKFGGDSTEYKAVPGYVLKPAIAAVLICPLAFLFPARREASGKALAACWAGLILTLILIGGHDLSTRVFNLQSVIGPYYMQDVFYCLLACEVLRQIRRLWLTHRADLLLHP